MYKSFKLRNNQRSKYSHQNLNVAQILFLNCLQCQIPCVTNIIPVFGTEEALVEPMLLALDTTESFLAVSAKKPTEKDSRHQRFFTARPEID